MMSGRVELENRKIKQNFGERRKQYQKQVWKNIVGEEGKSR